jgi:hypothetical protein
LLLARGKIIEEFFWDWGGTACEDFSLCANLQVDSDSRDDAGRSPEFWDRWVVDRDSDSILWGGPDWRGDLSLTYRARPKIDAPSLRGGKGAAHFDFPDCSDRDFDPTLDVDRLAADLEPIPDSDIPRDPGLLAGGSVLGRASGVRDGPRRGDDFYLPGVAFQNIYLREVVAWRE